MELIHICTHSSLFISNLFISIPENTVKEPNCVLTSKEIFFARNIYIYDLVALRHNP